MVNDYTAHMVDQAKIQAKYESRQRRKGLTRVTVWVPVEKRAGFIAAAKKMCVTNN